MPDYLVTLQRTVIQSTVLRVRARKIEDATRKATMTARSGDFGASSSMGDRSWHTIIQSCV